MKKYFKNFLMLAVILTFAIIVVPLTSEHGERSEETFNTNFSNNFNAQCSRYSITPVSNTE